MLFYVTLMLLGALLYGLFHYDAARTWKLKCADMKNALDHERVERVRAERHATYLFNCANSMLDALDTICQPNASQKTLDNLAKVRADIKKNFLPIMHEGKNRGTPTNS